MGGRCPILGPECEYCDCTGRTCQPIFPGLKVEWPELKGVEGMRAKEIIEKENPNVTAFIYPQNIFLPEKICCNRVLLYVPTDNCPNGPVLNLPMVG